jgi:hypothetical protein
MSKRIPLTPERIAQLRACPVMHVHEAQIVYNIGRNRLYAYMQDGSLPFKKLGNSTLLSVEALETFRSCCNPPWSRSLRAHRLRRVPPGLPRRLRAIRP